jgi:hypothetical protein
MFASRRAPCPDHACLPEPQARIIAVGGKRFYAEYEPGNDFAEALQSYNTGLGTRHAFELIKEAAFIQISVRSPAKLRSVQSRMSASVRKVTMRAALGEEDHSFGG